MMITPHTYVYVKTAKTNEVLPETGEMYDLMLRRERRTEVRV